LAFTNQCTQLNFANKTTGYVTVPCPDVPGNKISTTIQATSNNLSYFVPGVLEIDCTAGPNEGDGLIRFSFNPIAFTITGSSPNWTWEAAAGSNVISQTFGYYGWAISYPVQ
jgi:hypothetical protein